MKRKHKFYWAFSALLFISILISGFIDYQNKKELKQLEIQKLKLEIAILKLKKNG